METVRDQAVVPPELADARLDQALELLAPDLGMRGRRRLWESRRILVDGAPQPKGYRVQPGQTITLGPPLEENHLPDACADVSVLAQAVGLAALSKPAGLHCEARAGRPGPSLEACLERLLPGAELLNRLDAPTTGIVLAATEPAAAKAYLEAQERGETRKEYLAMTVGGPSGPVTIRNRLDTARKAAVRVLDQDNPDPLRWTKATPLLSLGPAVLVLAEIRKGARHQIRAHLAALGCPILGDDVYGRGEDCGLRLHHFRVTLPGFSATCPPPWPEWSSMARLEEAAVFISQ